MIPEFRLPRIASHQIELSVLFFHRLAEVVCVLDRPGKMRIRGAWLQGPVRQQAPAVGCPYQRSFDLRELSPKGPARDPMDPSIGVLRF